MNGKVSKICILDFQSVDLTWQMSDENKGRAIFNHFLEQCNQRDTRQCAARTIISDMGRVLTIKTVDYVGVDGSL